MGQIQDKMKATLAKTGIPYKAIECYGSQIVITSWSEKAARKWATLLGHFSTVRGVVKSVDYTKDTTEFYKANPGLCKSVVTHDVWLTFAAV